MKSKYRGYIFGIAVLLLAIVITDISYWIYVTTQYATFIESKTAYLNNFPLLLQNAVWLSLISIYLLACATFIFIQSIKAGYLKKTIHLFCRHV